MFYSTAIMPSPNDITFIIPVYDLKEDRIENLKFILPYIQSTGCRILVVEQIENDTSNLFEILSKFSKVEHILFKTPEKRFHKTGIINYAVFNHVNTKYVWVNDADFYIRFDEILQVDWISDFIQPYEIAKKLNHQDSNKILSGKKINVEFSDKTVKYISLYGALSFIFNADSFISIGAMDESIYGWGYEDVELSKRVNARYTVQQINIRGIHLWHPIDPDVNWEEHAMILTNNHTRLKKFDINTYFDKIYCISLASRPDRWEQVSQQFLENNIIVEKFTAVSESEITDDQFKIANPKNITGNNASIIGLVENKRALGCLLSHLSVIEDAKRNGYKKILIFEDDIFIGKHFFEKLKLIEKIKWKILYLGASQFTWSNINFIEEFYLAKNTQGTFAYAVAEDAYDGIIESFHNPRKSADNLLIELQEKWKNECFVFYPNIVISNVEDSNIRSSMNQQEYSNVVKWDLSNFFIPKKRKKILLVPDVPNWAFDNIANAIKRYNPYPEKIEYDIVYSRDLYLDKKIKISDWDLVYVMFEGERVIPDGKTIVRGCYSAYWIENEECSAKRIADFFSNCRACVFVNPELKRQVYPLMKNNVETDVIYDSSDETKFYPIENIKNKDFTVVFVGNTKRKVKNFSIIEQICAQANVALEVCESVPSKYLIYEYNRADICINFSTFEGGPQTFIEAALCKVPMLIRNTNELSKIIPCFKGETEEDFINTLNFLKRNRDICKFKGSEAYISALNGFTYKNTAKKFADFFLKV